MWRDLVNDADGTVRVDGDRQETTDGASAYGAAIGRFAGDAREAGSPVLVRSVSSDGESWFTVASDGSIALSDAPTGADRVQVAPVRRPPVADSPRRASTHAVSAAVAPVPLSVDTYTPETHRRPSAADFGAHRAEPAPSPAREGWRGGLNTASGGVLRFAPGPVELGRRQWRSSVQRGLSGHKTVVLVNLKGGATKTTASYLVGATLGRVRGGNVLAWDNNENQGTLGDLAVSASHDLTATDLLANIGRFAIPSNAPELMNYMRPQGENRFHVLASQNKASNQEVIDGAAFVQLHGMLRQFYHLIIVDTGNAATASTWQAAVEIADEIVLVALNKQDSAKKLAATVDTLVAQGLGEKLARGVLLLTEPARPARKGSARDRASDVQRAVTLEHFRHYVRDVVAVPYDEALADGSQVVFENLAPATQRAYLAATAAIVDGL